MGSGGQRGPGRAAEAGSGAASLVQVARRGGVGWGRRREGGGGGGGGGERRALREGAPAWNMAEVEPGAAASSGLRRGGTPRRWGERGAEGQPSRPGPGPGPAFRRRPPPAGPWSRSWSGSGKL